MRQYKACLGLHNSTHGQREKYNRHVSKNLIQTIPASSPS